MADVNDVNDEKLEVATEVGADETVLSNDQAAGRIKDLTVRLGADAVFDFKGVQPTMDIAAASAVIEGDGTIVGIAAAASRSHSARCRAKPRCRRRTGAAAAS